MFFLIAEKFAFEVWCKKKSNQDEQDEERVHQMDSSGCVVWECSDWEFLRDLSVLGILSVLVV